MTIAAISRFYRQLRPPLKQNSTTFDELSPRFHAMFTRSDSSQDVKNRLEIRRYESPCGVMSSSHPDSFKSPPVLRIPMWGYETWARVSTVLGSTGYESPCGVMRRWLALPASVIAALRIPMWGYEIRSVLTFFSSAIVTNPHVGL